VGQTSLVGYSILVVEDEPFIARCLHMILETAGAEVRRAANAREGLYFADQPRLSAAVLDCKHGMKSDHAIARRLTERGLPFVLYGAHELGRCEAWPAAPVVNKLANGAEIIETLCALLLPHPKPLPIAPRGASKATRLLSTHATTHVESLVRRRGLARPAASVGCHVRERPVST
jgi:CheY-like chemotaxis protein